MSSSFTAINQPQCQRPTPEPLATRLSQEKQAMCRATSTGKRRRNPTVAQYLGLGSSDEPAHLETYAPLPDGSQASHHKQDRKRQQIDKRDSRANHRHLESSQSDHMLQRRVSEGLRVTKPRNETVAMSKTSDLKAAHRGLVTRRQTRSENRQSSVDSDDHNSPSTHSFPSNVQQAASSHDHAITIRVASAHEIDQVNPFSDLSTDAYDASHLEQLDCDQLPSNYSIFDDESFEDDWNDDELLQLSSDMIDTGGSANFTSSPVKSVVVRAAHSKEDIQGSSACASTPVEEDISGTKRKSKKFVSPLTLTTRLFAATGDIDNAEARKPIIRPPFPAPVRDRSPIIGLSSKTMLRTCFRIGEVINQAHHAVKSGKHITFELYARILGSQRGDTKQYFTFCDLFHAKPPYLRAEYDGALWKSVQLFNYDSKRLLQQGRIARCMGTMKREDKQWVMEVANVWEATWEDVKWVEGIVNS